MTASECLALYKNSGHEVAVHGHTHPFLEQLPQSGVVYEIIKDREELERMFGCIIKGMAYPYGTFSDEVVEALRACGISYSRTTVSTEKFNIPTDWLRMPATCHHNNPRLMELAEKFAAIDGTKLTEPKLFYLWGHSYEFEDKDNWDVIEKFSEYMGGRDDVWYATNIEIYDYVTAYKSLVYSADGYRIYNPTLITLWIDVDGKMQYKIASGETVIVEE